MAVQVKVKMKHKNIQKLYETQKIALVQAMDATGTDLKQSGTMPFDYGTMQNQSTYIDESKAHKGKVQLVTDTEYAARLYFHPEYYFQAINNPNAGAGWFEPYIEGEKKKFIKKAYSERLKTLNERIGGR